MLNNVINVLVGFTAGAMLLAMFLIVARPDPAPDAWPATTPPRLVTVFTDHATGCEYLVAGSSSQGGITPRIAPDGRQICRFTVPK
jgi:hypothetical protein